MPNFNRDVDHIANGFNPSDTRPTSTTYVSTLRTAARCANVACSPATGYRGGAGNGWRGQQPPPGPTLRASGDLCVHFTNTAPIHDALPACVRLRRRVPVVQPVETFVYEFDAVRSACLYHCVVPLAKRCQRLYGAFIIDPGAGRREMVMVMHGCSLTSTA
jgi:hypothetical protein